MSSNTGSQEPPDTLENTESNYFERLGKALEGVTSKNPDKEQLIYFRLLNHDSEHRQRVADDMTKACHRATTITEHAKKGLSIITGLAPFLPPCSIQVTQRVLSQAIERFGRYRPTFMLDAVKKGDEPTFRYLYTECYLLNELDIPQGQLESCQMVDLPGQLGVRPAISPSQPLTYCRSETSDVNAVKTTEPTMETQDTSCSVTTRDPLADELSQYAKMPAKRTLSDRTIDLRYSLATHDGRTDHRVALVRATDLAREISQSEDYRDCLEAIEKTNLNHSQRSRADGIKYAMSIQWDHKIAEQLEEASNTSSKALKLGAEVFTEVGESILSLAKQLDHARELGRKIGLP